MESCNEEIEALIVKTISCQKKILNLTNNKEKIKQISILLNSAFAKYEKVNLKYQIMSERIKII